MKKLKIKNKDLFREQIATIGIALLTIVLTLIAGTYLKANGLASLFTTNVYKEAFETNPNDLVLITRIQVIVIVGIFALTFQELKYNLEIQKIKREEEELCKYLLQH